MTPGQRLSPECERDSAGADRSKFHAALLSFEKSLKDDTSPYSSTDMRERLRDPRRHGAFGDFEQRWRLRELQRESDMGSALVGWLSQPTAHRHAFERQRSGWKQTDVNRLRRATR
jgi:hypothetical protein